MGLLDRVRQFLKSQRQPSHSKTFGELDDIASPAVSSIAAKPHQQSGQSSITITPEFELAKIFLDEQVPFLFVTGRAGTGKTTFVRWIWEQYRGTCVVVAPTGLAALNAGGQTIHSFCRLPKGIVHLDDVKEERTRAIYAHLQLLIIDEISMVRVDIMEAIEYFLRLNGPRRGQPFGGVSILAVGDMHQLPPVVKGDEARQYLSDNFKSPYFFSARCLKDINIEVVELTRPFRQDNKEFLSLLNNLREGREISDTIHQLNERCISSRSDDPDWTVLVPTRIRAAKINETRLLELSGELREFTGKVIGTFLLGRRNIVDLSDDELDKELPSPYRLRIKAGAIVVFTKNDASDRWVNGTIGRIAEIRENTIVVEMGYTNDDSRLWEVSPASWERYRYIYDRTENRIVREVIGSYEQFPLALAWAMTIHKAQGQTLDRALVDLDRGAFAAGQTYVAISRCRSIEGLRLKRAIRSSDVLYDPTIVRLYRRVAEITANRLLADESRNQ
ncbi:MAG: ATP-dependent DNA helicase [Phycisphaerales bacterium]